MKKRCTALLLALVMALSLGFSALGEAAVPQEPAQDPVLATVMGEDLTKSMVDAQIPGLLQEQIITDPSDYRAVLDLMVRRRILLKKVGEMGFDQFTPEEESAFANEARQLWDNQVSSLADYYQSSDNTQAREDALKQGEAMLQGMGYTLDMVVKDLREQAGTDRMVEHLLGGYEPSEEDIQRTFQEFGAMYQQSYANDIAQYEYMTMYMNQPSWYTPAGYRGVIHILLIPEAAPFDHYKALLAGFEEQTQQAEVPVEGGEGETQPSEAPDAAPVITQEMLDEARQAVMDSRKADIDMIYQRLERGENFVDLVREYGEDPGMTDENNLQNGYAVHAQSIIYDPVFTAAAFQDKVQKVGDVSDPVLGSFGIHILQYLRDVPSGLIMTDAIRQEIANYLESEKLNTAFGQAFTQWMAEEEVVYHQEAIDAAIAQGSPAQSPEELPLEAVPDSEDLEP